MINKNISSYRDNLKKNIFILFVLLIIIYGVFKISNYLSGPKITIYSPLPYEIIKEDVFVIKGQALDSKNVYINGREINIDENGNFEEALVLENGYTISTLRAKDRYGRETRVVRSFVYTPASIIK